MCVIDHVYADVGDDNIAIKSGPINSPGPDDPSRDITITDCTFLHGHGLSIGSEIAGGARNIAPSAFISRERTMAFASRRIATAATMWAHLFFRDIEMKDVKNALIISEYYPKRSAARYEAAQPVTRLTPHFHDITLENRNSHRQQISRSRSWGCRKSPITGVVSAQCEDQRPDGIDDRLCRGDSGENVTVQAEAGEAIAKQAGAKVTLR
jgi:polygalacturonase